LWRFEYAIEKAAEAKQIEVLEERVRSNPNQPSAAWDLARIKLESYLDRNLAQVSWIYLLVLLIMVAGFVLVGIGIWKLYQKPASFNPSIVTAVSGILTKHI
jgi:hypothetical protein